MYIDMDYRSLNHAGEELCGDKVEMVLTEHSHILILADGMGSGVKANILASLTSRILATMFREGAAIDECLSTILATLPICQERHVAYCTFTVLQVNDDNSAYLVEYDNPDTILIRKGEITELERTKRTIEGKEIQEARFTVQDGDVYVIMSDGCLYASSGLKLNMNWDRNRLAKIAKTSSRISPYSKRIAFDIVQACDDQYWGQPGDDTTAAVMRISAPHTLKLFTGPPVHKEDDEAVVRYLMQDDENGEDCTRIVCGGTSAKIVSRILNKPIEPVKQDPHPEIPPYDSIAGIDLVTEGVLTLNKVIDLLKPCVLGKSLDELFFDELDQDNGAALIATALFEDCSHLELLIGQAINEAYENPEISTDLATRIHLTQELIDTAKALGKTVSVKYY
ncbi:MAG: serine/threonine-protein phosphatase [Lachnospiraceae bacterium]|nr:serine/threonine-protein phosphatase [Lachnospiraceae bacterium]